MVLKPGATIRKDWDTLKASFLEHFKYQTLGGKSWVSKPSSGKYRGHFPILKTSRRFSRWDPQKWSRCWYGYHPRHGKWGWEETDLIWMLQRLRVYFAESQEAYSSSLFEVRKTSLFDYQPQGHRAPQMKHFVRWSSQLLHLYRPSCKAWGSIGTALQNLNWVPVPLQLAQVGRAQKPYETSRNLSDIQCYICGKIGRYTSTHSGLEVLYNC